MKKYIKVSLSDWRQNIMGMENDLHVCGIIFQVECAANYNLVEFPLEYFHNF